MTDPPVPQQPARHLLESATLPCGADVDLLLEQVADGRGTDLDDHQQECVHCQAAIAEVGALWQPVTEVAGDRYLHRRASPRRS